MNEKKYRISFSGVVIEGYDPDRVKRNFQTALRFDKKTIDRLFSGRTVILKKQADYRTALSFQSKFRKAGAVCTVKELHLKKTGHDKTPGEQSREKEKRQVPAITCPKCGHEQDESKECSRCGIIFSKVRDRAERPAPPAKAWEPDEGFDLITLKNGVAIALIVSFVLLLGAFFMKDRLPDPDLGIKKLYRLPVQTKTRKKPFFVTAGDTRYTIEPLFDYELHGLVVTYYDSTGWWDVTHKFLWKDFLNIKDICVVYGLNARSGVYKDIIWKSGSWTCHAKPKRKLRRAFSSACFSNNHLLSAEKIVQKEIMRAERGDVVRLKGYLAKYHHKNGSRGSSTSRFDTGDAACETIFVEEFEILKKSNRIWRILFTIATYIVAGCLIAMIAIYIKEMRTPPGEYETEGIGEAGSISTPILKSGDRAGKKHKVKIIAQVLILLALLYMWARLH